MKALTYLLENKAGEPTPLTWAHRPDLIRGRVIGIQTRVNVATIIPGGISSPFVSTPAPTAKKPKALA